MGDRVTDQSKPSQQLVMTPQLQLAITVRQLAEKIGMHESTITRAAGAVQFRTLHGLWGFEVAKGKLSVRHCVG